MVNNIKLLVSPRNLDEARVTIDSNVDYIDCKNPEEGSLGANFPWVIRSIKDIMPKNGTQKLSATIGDFPYLPGSASLAALGATFSGADIIKVGLKGPSNVEEGAFLMSKVVEGVKSYNQNALVVAAGYADRDRLKFSPHFLDIPVIASKANADIAMLDTYIKDGKGLFDFLTIEQLEKFVKRTRELNLQAALAGNLQMEDIVRIKSLNPDIIGIRSVVCENNDRNLGSIKGDLIDSFRMELYH